MKFTQHQKQQIIQQVEETLDIKTWEWYFKEECKSYRICIWITRGGRIALRFQTGGLQSEKTPSRPCYHILDEPRYFTTVAGLLKRISLHIKPKLKGYRIAKDV